MELMVSTVVLTILVYSVGLLMSSVKSTVVETQGMLRANAAASGVGYVVRGDFYKCSKLGFLRVDKDMISFTVAGDVQSVMGTARGNGGIIAYGLCPNGGLDEMGDKLTSKIFFRRMLVLDSTDRTGADKYPGKKDFSDIQMSKNITQFIPTTVPSGLKIPVESLADVSNLWQVLAAFCELSKDKNVNVLFLSCFP